jgi:gliding motility associated protien GldN
MNKQFLKLLAITVLCSFIAVDASAQKKRAVKKRPATTKTAKTKTKSKVSGGGTGTVANAAPAPTPDSLPVKTVLPSLRPDEAVETSSLRDRTPLPYEHLRADDALFRHKIWREIDTREKMNLPFRYAADENNGNQRFISILLKAIQDSAVVAFDAIDDRFTTPMKLGDIAVKLGAGKTDVTVYGPDGLPSGTKTVNKEINLDSFYKFQVKEEVIFDKESSRLFWRILGIAPTKRIITESGIDFGEAPLFWVYYPDMRPVFAKYEVFNGKNFAGRMSWEELFESRMFNGRIVKSTIDNPMDKFIKEVPGFKDSNLLQLFEGENVKEKIFNYEQDLWSY